LRAWHGHDNDSLLYSKFFQDADPPKHFDMIVMIVRDHSPSMNVYNEWRTTLVVKMISFSSIIYSSENDDSYKRPYRGLSLVLVQVVDRKSGLP
jgi:hypothetical protein